MQSIKKAEGVDSIKKNAICSQFIVSGTKSCIPLVKSNGGNLITVTTNSEKNVAFYINNGFTLVKEETLECNAKSIGNWTFRMDL